MWLYIRLCFAAVFSLHWPVVVVVVVVVIVVVLHLGVIIRCYVLMSLIQNYAKNIKILNFKMCCNPCLSRLRLNGFTEQSGLSDISFRLYTKDSWFESQPVLQLS
jgi:hypothetical protein